MSRATGLVAGFLMAVSPVHIWYFQEARPYSASLFLLLLAMYAFYRLQGSRSRNWSLVYAASLLGVVFTHYYMATFLFVFGVLAFLTKGPNRARIITITSWFSCSWGSTWGRRCTSRMSRLLAPTFERSILTRPGCCSSTGFSVVLRSDAHPDGFLAMINFGSGLVVTRRLPAGDKGMHKGQHRDP